MSEHKSHLSWNRGTIDFSYESYDRSHQIEFPGRQSLTGSSAPEFLGKADFANPEEMLAASLSSCHMLTFLAIASRSRVVVDKYSDDATAYLGKGPMGKFEVTKVILRPQVTFAPGQEVTAEKLAHFHEKAHENCFIANSVKCEVTIEN